MSAEDENLNKAIQLLRAPCTVRKLNIIGNRRTKRALIEAELQAALVAKTHEDLAVELALASQRLKDLDVFKSATCEVDVVPDGSPGEVNVSVQVIFMILALQFYASFESYLLMFNNYCEQLAEKGTHTLSTGTYVQGGEGNVEVSCTLRNIMGNAEKLQGNISVGHKTSNSFKLDATQPLQFGSTARLNVSAFQTLANFVKYRCKWKLPSHVPAPLTHPKPKTETLAAPAAQLVPRTAAGRLHLRRGRRQPSRGHVPRRLADRHAGEGHLCLVHPVPKAPAAAVARRTDSTPACLFASPRLAFGSS